MTRVQVHVIRRRSSVPITGAFSHCFSRQKGLSQEIGVHPRTWWSGFFFVCFCFCFAFLYAHHVNLAARGVFLECGRLRALSNFSFESQEIESAREGWAAKQRGTRAVALFLFTSSLLHLLKPKFCIILLLSLAALSFEERRMTARGVRMFVVRYFGVGCRPTDLRPKPETTHEKSWQPRYHHP